MRAQQWAAMTRLLLTLAGLGHLAPEFLELVARLSLRLEKSGSKYATQYMKQCLAIILCYINRERYVMPPSVPSVAVATCGLPRIIPVRLRHSVLHAIDSGGVNILVLRAVLTVFSYNRALPVGSPVKLDTITDHFTGSSRFLPWGSIRPVCQELAKRFSYRGLSWPVISNNAGPNSESATWSAGLDALAFLSHPGQFVYLTLFCILSGQFWIPVGIILV